VLIRKNKQGRPPNMAEQKLQSSRISPETASRNKALYRLEGGHPQNGHLTRRPRSMVLLDERGPVGSLGVSRTPIPRRDCDAGQRTGCVKPVPAPVALSRPSTPPPHPPVRTKNRDRGHIFGPGAAPLESICGRG